MATRSKTSKRGSSQLETLAELYGIQATYQDMSGKPRSSPPESLLRVLQMLGAPVARMDDVNNAIREREVAAWQRGVEPVSIAWDDEAGHIALRLRQGDAERKLAGALLLETGEMRSLVWNLRDLPEVSTSEDMDHVEKRLPLPAGLPWGCHRLLLELPSRTLTSTVISAPRRAYSPEGEKTWGAFLPLYALHTERSWGAGDFQDLARFIQQIREAGGGVVATLPLLAAFLDEPYEASPYSPASRLFWNEFYLAIDSLPEFQASQAARSLAASADFVREIANLRALPLVDYRRQMQLKRRVLSEMVRIFFDTPSERRAAFDRYVAANPHAEDYARFRAVGDRLRTPWMHWPTPLRDGTIRSGDYDEGDFRYHAFVQWLAEEQMTALAKQAREAGPGLYLDLPLGVNGAGYDVWRERDAFALDASGGCPPDPVFTRGQDWGFPPLHPERIREQGYRYVRAFLHHQAKHAGIVRIDHMPVFHRLYWVPHGMEAKDGVYVRYRSEELYALFNIESHRHKTRLVGEDLGTVPPEVPEAMARHGVGRMYVIEYGLTADPKAALPPVPEGAVASVNTHDMPPFEAYRRGDDLRLRQELGLLGGANPEREAEQRQAMIDALTRFLAVAGYPVTGDDPNALLQSCLAFLASSPASVTLLNLEDLWRETKPQNTPSTGPERPNWRMRAKYSLEQMLALPEVLEAFRLMRETPR
ncbi:MAG: 4-alpha-glucanotransferase [Gemmataceae bacterium]|nr:4-alpha-glucanotransferase [Gemmataceae bacterium]